MVPVAAAVLSAVVLFLPASYATVVQLESGNYTTYLHAVDPGANVAMEYYAGWCPHCKHFAPTYDLVGSHFMDTDDPTVIVARVDCAQNVCFQPLLLCTLPAMVWDLLKTQHWFACLSSSGQREREKS